MNPRATFMQTQLPVSVACTGRAKDTSSQPSACSKTILFLLLAVFWSWESSSSPFTSALPKGNNASVYLRSLNKIMVSEASN